MLIPAALSLRQQRHGVHTAQGRLHPLPISIPYSAPASQQPGSLPLPPPVGPYPSRCPCGRAAGGSCGGPRCAGSSPRVRRWSRGTACRCSGPACAPTRCGCWRSALQGRARREAQRSPPPRAMGAVLGAGCSVPWLVMGATGLGSAGANGGRRPLTPSPASIGGSLPNGRTPNVGAGSEAVPPPALTSLCWSPLRMELRTAVSNPALELGGLGRTRAQAAPAAPSPAASALRTRLGASWGHTASDPRCLRAYLGSIPSPCGSHNGRSLPSPCAPLYSLGSITAPRGASPIPCSPHHHPPPPPSDRKQPPTSRCQTNLESLLSQSMGGVG